MEDFFDPEIFNIVKNENDYIISTKDGKQCLKFTFKNGTIYVNKLEKCGSNGTILLKLLEEYAKSADIIEIELQDASELNTNCVDESGKEIWINLALLKLLTTGKSWYNSLGYVSSESNAEEIAETPCIDAIFLSRDEKISEIGGSNDDDTEIRRVIQDAENIIISAEELFPHVDLTLNVKEYLLAILPKKFFSGGNCQQYKFIGDLLEFINTLSDYDVFLKKTLTGGRKKTRHKRKNNGSRKAKSGKLRK